MAITPQILEQRKTYLGSSDIAAILGLNPFSDQFDVLSSKRPDLVEPRERGDMRKADFGTRMEPVLRGWLADDLGRTVRECTRTYRHPKHECIAANPDALVLREWCKVSDAPGLEVFEGDVPPEESDAAVEAFGELKVSGLDAGWGEPGSDDVPPMVMAQAQWQMGCAEAVGVVHVVRCAAGRDWTPSRYLVTRDDETIGNMIDAGLRWWTDCVVGGQLPKPDVESPPMLDAVMRIRRTPGKAVELDPALVAGWLKAKAAASEAEKWADGAKALILAALGDARVGLVGNGQYGTWTLADESGGMRVDTERLKAEYPAVYAAVCKESRRNMPRWKPVKGVELPGLAASPGGSASKQGARA